MGSAVSAVSGAIGGVLGSGIQGITQGVIPGASLSSQDQANKQIAGLQTQSGTATTNSQNLQGQAQTGAQNVINQLGTARDYAEQAQNLNNGGNVANSLGLLQSQANGTAPSAAQGVLQQGTDQAIATQHALANSGNLSQMIGGQKTAMDNAANLVQQSANQASQLRANQQQIGQQNYAAASQQQAAQAGINTGAATNIAGQYGNLYGAQQQAALGYGQLANSTSANAGNIAIGGQGIQQGAQNQAQAQQAQAAGGMLNGIGGAAVALAPMLMSDMRLKEDVHSDRAARSKGVSDYFREQNSKPEPESKPESEPKTEAAPDTVDDAQMKARKDIKKGFISSDKNCKEDIKKDSMLHAFLSQLDPVTFDYKDPNGEAGKTPGKHMGIIAQDVEAAPGGASMVKDTPEGKAIDLASAVGMLMSAAADAHHRVSSLEELFKAKKAK